MQKSVALKRQRSRCDSGSSGHFFKARLMYQLAWRSSKPLGPGQHRGRARLSIPAWQIELMAPPVKGTTPVQLRPRDHLFIGSWFSGNSRPFRLRSGEPWECKSPRADDFITRMPKEPRRRIANPLLPGASPGRVSIFSGGVVQEPDAAPTSRRSRRQLLASPPLSLTSSSTVEPPAVNRKADGANPSWSAISHSVEASAATRPVGCGANPVASPGNGSEFIPTCNRSYKMAHSGRCRGGSVRECGRAA